MKTLAAVLRNTNEPFTIEELTLEPPRDGEVQVKISTAGLCHTDLHIQTGDMPVEFPYLAGHEGAGVVEQVGPGVSRVAPGDHVVLSFVPVCGTCRWCSTGHQNLCDRGAGVLTGAQLDGTFRMFRSDGTPIPQFAGLGTFSERVVVSEAACVKIDNEISLEAAALVGCGVATGYGSSVYAAGVGSGDTVVVYGLGGIGAAAVQGARIAGAVNVVAVDPVEWKADMAKKLGATAFVTDSPKAAEAVQHLTRGVGADHAIVCAGLVEPALVGEAMAVIRKGGQVTLTGTVSANEPQLPISGFEMLVLEKNLKGTLYGMANPHHDIPRILELYKAGRMYLDELVTRRYTLSEINEGYSDMLSGKNIRGVIDFT